MGMAQWVPLEPLMKRNELDVGPPEFRVAGGTRRGGLDAVCGARPFGIAENQR